ncbi:hypothetical protein [Streptomyces sp. NPDC051109]|uniref:hypothetical protein n=1 Tax=Streptomyces sp. NPDC051109 TaxID=3365642 RepID=UPI00269629E5
MAATYRRLRKAFEDSKNEPGAADFYYGEMEMRRHDRTGTPSAERGLLHGYWLLSGYGLRASRALGWLAAAMLATIILLMGFGIPQASPKQKATGAEPRGGGKAALVIDKADPQNPTGDRFTGKRFDKALSTTLNSVVFRSSGQDLTTTGTYIEMTSRHRTHSPRPGHPRRKRTHQTLTPPARCPADEPTTATHRQRSPKAKSARRWRQGPAPHDTVQVITRRSLGTGPRTPADTPEPRRARLSQRKAPRDSPQRKPSPQPTR